MLVHGTVRALLRRVAENDSVPVTLSEVSEGGLRVVVPGMPPPSGARVTVEMAIWRQMLFLPANVVWSRPVGASSATCGLKLHLEVTDATSRRTFAGWVRSQVAPPETAPPPEPERPYGTPAGPVPPPPRRPRPSRLAALIQRIFGRG